jgi:hypothetical protein
MRTDLIKALKLTEFAGTDASYRRWSCMVRLFFRSAEFGFDTKRARR